MPWSAFVCSPTRPETESGAEPANGRDGPTNAGKATRKRTRHVVIAIGQRLGIQTGFNWSRMLGKMQANLAQHFRVLPCPSLYGSNTTKRRGGRPPPSGGPTCISWAT